jgi:hypothetical protein
MNAFLFMFTLVLVTIFMERIKCLVVYFGFSSVSKGQ